MRAWFTDCLGAESATALFRAFGGDRLKIPPNPYGAPFDRIAQVIGQGKAAHLVKIAACDCFNIPVASQFEHRKAIHDEIERRLNEGQSARYIAMTYRTPPLRLTERTIRKIKAAMMEKERCAASAQNYAAKPDSGAGCVAKFIQSTQQTTQSAHFGQNTTDELHQRSGDADGLE